MSPKRLIALVLAMAVAGGTTIATPASSAWAATCKSPEKPGGVITDTPWPQTLLAPERVWPISTGQGVTVAVVDGGTDGANIQLKGAVANGYDFVEKKAAGNSSCISRGTAVSTIIAARQTTGIGFQGFAPNATILPIRVTDKEVNDNQYDKPSATLPAAMATGIRWAVDHRAHVVVVTTAIYFDDKQLKSAVDYARSRNVVIVAPVGDNHRDRPPDPLPYPAAYDGVIGVGSIEQSGERAKSSQVGDYVDVVAPGVDVVGATLYGGYKTFTGTGFATAFAAATVALIRQVHPQLSVADVERRMRATASPSPGGGQGLAYGAGLIDPYRAVTETVAGQPPAAAAPLPSPVIDPATVELARRQSDAQSMALWLTLAGIGLALAAIAAAVAIPTGRRRHWRAGRQNGAATTSIDDEIASNYRIPMTSKEAFAPPSTNNRR